MVFHEIRGTHGIRGGGPIEYVYDDGKANAVLEHLDCTASARWDAFHSASTYPKMPPSVLGKSAGTCLLWYTRFDIKTKITVIG